VVLVAVLRNKKPSPREENLGLSALANSHIWQAYDGGKDCCCAGHMRCSNVAYNNFFRKEPLYSEQEKKEEGGRAQAGRANLWGLAQEALRRSLVQGRTRRPMASKTPDAFAFIAVRTPLRRRHSQNAL